MKNTFLHPDGMKDRVWKKRMHREVLIALRNGKRELGDHRRWAWMVTSPWTEADGWTWRFDVKQGLLGRPPYYPKPRTETA